MWFESETKEVKRRQKVKNNKKERKTEEIQENRVKEIELSVNGWDSRAKNIEKAHRESINEIDN